MNDINTLRNYMFDTMDAIRSGSMKAQEANAMAGAAQTIINSLKVEIEARRLAGTKQLAPFLQETEVSSLSPEEIALEAKELDALLPRDLPAGRSVTRHYMNGDEGNE